MSGRFVRASKYRHVFGRSTKKEQCYDNLRITKNAWDTNLIKVNPQYISVNWEASGGGAFAVIPINERGRLPEQLPLFRGHTAAVLDTDWSPFDDSLLASASDDGKVFIWQVPENFTLHTDADEPTDVAPVARLTGHSRKVGHVLFNPSAANVLASSSGDYITKLWDVEAGQTKLNLKHGDIVQSLSWSADGSMLVTTCRDKKLRIWDVRQEKPAQEVQGHTGAKNSRVVWMGEHDRVATTGFSKMSDRQLGLWDIRAAREPMGGFQFLDSISGVCMPFWDDGTQMLYLAGKGDGNIRYFEYENGKFEYLSEYKSADPQRGIAFLPKRGINLHENEIMRAFKTVNDAYIEPISFIVPRRAEVFQGDIYPPTVGLKPSMSASDWFAGKEGLPPKISLESVYEGEEPAEVPAESKPSASTPLTSPPPAASPIKVMGGPSKIKAIQESAAEARAERAAMAEKSEPKLSVEDNKASMASMADRVAAKDAESDDDEDDDSSFEEISKPAERPSASTTAKMEEKTRGPVMAQEPEPSKSKFAPASATPSANKAAAVSSSAAAATASTPTATTPTPASPPSSGGGPGEALKSHLQDIKEQQSRLMSMLEAQNRVMARQSEQIEGLTGEVEKLKAGASTGQAGAGADKEKDEKIRRLELELEEAKS
ncbi:DUF1900-domain-containing protein [Aulographum hederae CBS 113979]|uniref:Coronin n=1 Tax=Aulographum hederae CBS 113979 TaxID=1176131 RepID=A0A6G1GQ59_9PEZI|nr:DUF1900-domain-containing protein [Aulographum hederae CBS 113979]